MVEEQDKPQPSLELPSLFGGRKRRGKGAGPSPAPAASEPEPEVEPEPAAEPEPTTSPAPAPEPAFAPEPEADERPTPAPVIGDIGEPPPAEPAAPPVVEPVAAAPAPVAPEVHETREARRPVVETVPSGTPLFDDEPVEPEPVMPSTETLLDQQAAVELDEPAPAPPRRRRTANLRRPTGYAAAALVGLVVGALIVGLTAGALRGCEAVRGTATCGGGAGITLLVVILVLMVVLGGVLLRLLGVADPTSTSFLAVGLVAVVCLLFLVGSLLSPWMILVIPALSVAAYLGAQWVTTAFVETD